MASSVQMGGRQGGTKSLAWKMTGSLSGDCEMQTVVLHVVMDGKRLILGAALFVCVPDEPVFGTHMAFGSSGVFETLRLTSLQNPAPLLLSKRLTRCRMRPYKGLDSLSELLDFIRLERPFCSFWRIHSGSEPGPHLREDICRGTFMACGLLDPRFGGVRGKCV